MTLMKNSNNNKPLFPQNLKKIFTANNLKKFKYQGV